MRVMANSSEPMALWLTIAMKHEKCFSSQITRPMMSEEWHIAPVDTLPPDPQPDQSGSQQPSLPKRGSQANLSKSCYGIGSQPIIANRNYRNLDEGSDKKDPLLTLFIQVASVMSDSHAKVMDNKVEA
jgi:hypothetical protein